MIKPIHQQFLISLIGRANVGKSTLFNRLVVKSYERKNRLTADMPGLTRDIEVRSAQVLNARFMVADTVGFQPIKDAMDEKARQLLYGLITRSNLLIFMVDGLVPLNQLDWQLAEFILKQQRQGAQPAYNCIVVINKGENSNKLLNARGEVADLLAKYPINRVNGVAVEPVVMSASHGIGMMELYDCLIKILPEEAFADDQDQDDQADDQMDEEAGEWGKDYDDIDDAINKAAKTPPEKEKTKPTKQRSASQIRNDRQSTIKLVILGRPNVGKSTLTNRLIGEEVVLTGDLAGTTRDATYHDFTRVINNQPVDFQVIDTAGIRRRAKITEAVEKQSVDLALTALRFAHVAILMIDATAPLEQQDMAIIKLVIQEGRPFCLVLNKWDLVENKKRARAEIERQVSYLLPRVKDLPIMPLNALDGKGIYQLLLAIKQLHTRWGKRIDTASLNRWLRRAMEKNPPPSRRGLRAKINFIINVKSRPPHFVIFLTRKDLMNENYLRYLENSLKDEFDFAGVPFRWTMRVKKNPFD
ncbi:MAG: ribosome biogenesis GTPase Der [Hydrotalea sp.]|nr:ribosome biogenesis GTPase Der [Hydrotalea sp.]